MTAVRGRRTRVGSSLTGALALGLGLVVVVAAGGAVGGGKPPHASPSPSASITPSPSPGEGVITGRVGVSPITLGLELALRTAKAGYPVQVRATIVNQARKPISSIAVNLTSEPTGISLRQPHDRLVRRLAPGAGEVVIWTACASRSGTYVFVATARVEGTTITSAPAVLTVSAGGSC